MKFNVTSTVISTVNLPGIDTVEEAVRELRKGRIDLIKDSEDVTNVTMESGVDEDEVELVKDDDGGSRPVLYLKKFTDFRNNFVSYYLSTDPGNNSNAMYFRSNSQLGVTSPQHFNEKEDARKAGELAGFRVVE